MSVPGFSLFAALGVQMGLPSRAQVGAGQEKSGSGRVIDVTARRVQRSADETGRSVATSARMATSVSGKPQIAAYARPAHSGEAPRLQYFSASPGQTVDTWA